MAVASDDSYGRIADAISNADLFGDWWLKVVFTPVAAEVDDQIVSVWWSDLAGDFYGISLDWVTGLFTANAGASVFPAVSAVVTPDLAVEHEFVMQYRTGGGIELFMDDVSIGSGSQVIAPSGARDFTVELNLGAVVTSPEISNVAGGVGTYPG